MINYSMTKEDILNKIISESKIIETKMDIATRRATGSFFTSLELSTNMMKELFESFSDDFISNIETKKFLEPCVGTGSFVFAYLLQIYKLELPKEKIFNVIKNIYVCDINDNALNTYKALFTQFVYTYFDITIDDTFFNEKIAHALLFDINDSNLNHIDISNVFPKVMSSGGFDIIATNPPYKNLKADKKKYISSESYLKDKELYSKISNVVSKSFKYSNEGVLNLYKLFVEEILCNYSNSNAYISLLIPNTILSDKTCKKLRDYIILNHKIISINVINENNTYLDAQQSLCTLLINKGLPTNDIKINTDYKISEKNSSIINIKNILNSELNNSLFMLKENEYIWLNKLNNYPKIKELDFIVNMRGELDLTLNKEAITDTGSLPLLRGRNIDSYSLKECNIEFVDNNFIEKTNKKKYIFNPRIACQQISNINKKKRINFAFIPENHILGNSCNFIYVDKNNYNIDLYYMLGLLNSNIINWYFKLISSNNHINNYEIDSFPVPIHSKHNIEISNLVKKYLASNDSNILIQIDELILKSFDIKPSSPSDKNELNSLTKKFYLDMQNIIPNFTQNNAEDIINSNLKLDTLISTLTPGISKFEKKVCEGIAEKYLKIKNNEILNHTTFKLSDLDLEMIKNIPQGGNWKDIPEETIKKSKRLSRITETGGRTTLYGRIDYTKPSYTITTYFNRPGNGTYVHPNLDRVLSVREASRFQSFNDDYYFYGNKTDLLKQVGNAVPPVLAKEIATCIKKKIDCNKSIDLFCGAGGMTSGFKQAGIHSILGNDFNESACITFKINNPTTKVICDDITNQSVKNSIISIAKKEKIDMICGGPPCQGFSYAGKRFIDDPRNQLFKDFIDIVKEVMPKIVVMENVEGILTFDNGNVYKQINELYKEMGYNIKGNVLTASNYGVPQKRKRVIIICVRKDINVMPDDLFPIPTTPNSDEQINAYQAIADLENITCSDNVKYDNSITSSYVQKLKEVYMLNNTKFNIPSQIKSEQLSLF